MDPSTVAANAAAAMGASGAPGAAGGNVNRGAVAGGVARPGGPGNPGAGNPAPLRPGMFARVNTVFSINDAALVVPEESIVPQGGRQFVIKAVTPDQVPQVDVSQLPPEVKFVSLRQEVRLGIRRAGRVEIVSGLDEGQSVVVAGHQRLQRDGTPLRLVELGSRPPQSGGQGGGQGGPGGPAGPGSPGGPVAAASAPVARVAPAPSR